VAAPPRADPIIAKEHALPRAPAKPTSCDRYTLGAGPAAGWSFGDDQLVTELGAQLGYSCLRWVRLEPRLGLGLGGNWGSVRFGARTRLTLFLGAHQEYGLTLLGGFAGVRSFPLGRFASFCRRVDLNECFSTDTGAELGGGFEYWDLSLLVAAGFGTLPDVVVTLGWSYPVHPAVQRLR
jgi:hypothetical protein